MDGMSMMLKSFGIDKDAVLGDLEKMKGEVNNFAVNLNNRVTNLEKLSEAIAASQVLLHAKLDKLIADSEVPRTDFLLKLKEATAPIFPAGDDGLYDAGLIQDDNKSVGVPVIGSQFNETPSGQTFQSVNGAQYYGRVQTI